MLQSGIVMTSFAPLISHAMAVVPALLVLSGLRTRPYRHNVGVAYPPSFMTGTALLRW